MVLVFRFNLWLKNKLALERAHTNILMVRDPFKLCYGLKMNSYTYIARPKNKEMSRRNRDIDRQTGEMLNGRPTTDKDSASFGQQCSYYVL